ncbi:helix-turn-helix domain-containing protein [Nocardia jiangxiensis]|uniref:helix-turn-helix domain-containing protein n=1 Tax=Nocardia jiangxiensis TaxID=282685 RepID=UPI00030AF80E|nr:helix-turn-helix domain-containing protein [Nocardia jiangxiensis]
MTTDRFMTVQEAADDLKVSRYSVYQLIWAGEVQSVKVGRCRRIVRQSFDAYVVGLIEDAAA